MSNSNSAVVSPTERSNEEVLLELEAAWETYGEKALREAEPHIVMAMVALLEDYDDAD
jgi:hypothetical protein